MNRDEFIKSNPIGAVLESRGVKTMGGGVQRSGRCPFHEDKSASFSVNTSTGLWHCHAGCGGGSVIDLLAKFDGKSPSEILRNNGVEKPAQPKVVEQDEPKFQTVATYDYCDVFGNLVYQVVRQHAASKEKPCGYVKTFRQRQPDSRGGWVYSMEGVERVLYRVAEVSKAETVWIVEGEKDAGSLVELGLVATCNVGGAGKWLDGYSETLTGKTVVICGDNDDAGKAHVKTVFDAIAGKAKSVRIVNVPKLFKDATEYVQSFSDKAQARTAFDDLFQDAIPCVRGVSLPLLKISELEPIYQRYVGRIDQSSLKLGNWLPTLGRHVRGLVPGELVLILGATGIGKTAVLSNIAVKAHPLPTLFFELELPPELMFERLISLSTSSLQQPISCENVERGYRAGDFVGQHAIEKGKLNHIYISTQPRLTIDEIERITVQSSLKIGERPKLVLLDYVGLVRGSGSSRYEKVSQVAEDLKVMAKATQTVVVVASQVSRRDDAPTPEINLTDGKDSGSLENSAGLVLGVWRDQKDAAKMYMKVLKNTKGSAGATIACNYNLGTLAITEMAEGYYANDN